MSKRVFLFVLDSFGIGAAPDSDRFGDAGCNTLGSLLPSASLQVPNLQRMGLFNIEGTDASRAAEHPTALFGRMQEASAGKDTTIGHWELAGVISPQPLPTYPNGFPQHLIDAFAAATGRGVLCNRPYSGTQVIADYGPKQQQSGDWIVYTSADSVFQIAAHEQVIPLEELMRACQTARDLLTDEHAVGRVIARPYIGSPDHYTRTANRRDFSLEAPDTTLLDRLCSAGKDVIAVGKIGDIFAGRGITRTVHTKGNDQGMQAALLWQKQNFDGLCFINLVDFDMLYGHRNDVDGYAAALSRFDAFLPTFQAGMNPDDVLIVTADHGCDPAFAGTDHTREYVPLLIYGARIAPRALGTRRSFADLGCSLARLLGVADTPNGTAFSL